MRSAMASMRRNLAPIFVRARLVLGLVRVLVLGAVILFAGTAGGYLGSVLSGMDRDRAGPESHSLGIHGLQAVYLSRGPGKFEQLGRSVDDFNAQLNENWDMWASLGRYVFAQGHAELTRAWTSPRAISETTDGPLSHQVATAVAAE